MRNCWIRLNAWTLSSLVDGTSEEGLSVELREGLAGAGFHYHVSGGTIEITPEAVVSVLAEFVNPRLLQLLSLQLEGQQLEGQATSEQPHAG